MNKFIHHSLLASLFCCGLAHADTYHNEASSKVIAKRMRQHLDEIHNDFLQCRQQNFPLWECIAKKRSVRQAALELSHGAVDYEEQQGILDDLDQD